jgi:hypothetical protein
MLDGIVAKIKWAALVAAFAGPAFAGWTYYQRTQVDQVMAQGVETVGYVDGGSVREGRRSGKTYKLHTIWVDQDGGEHAEDITVSSSYAESVIVDDQIMVDAVHVRYVPGNADLPVIISEDAPLAQQDKMNAIYLFGGGGVAGIVISLLFFLFGRKKREEAPEATPA